MGRPHDRRAEGALVPTSGAPRRSEAVKAMEPPIKLGGMMKRHVADSQVAEHMPSLPG